MAGPITPISQGPSLSRGLPRTRPAGKFVPPPVTPTPNISRAFAVSEGGGGVPNPSFGTSARPVGLPGGDISPVAQESAILSSPGRGLSSKFSSPPGAVAGIAGPGGGGGLDELGDVDPLDELIKSLLG